MGIARFFRFITERYPLTLTSTGPNDIPQFDTLYLDMNGIIHTCSHPTDDPTFRITEPQIFNAISSYIDYIFLLIKPTSEFILAVDGVAPRAKMNQQRSRRFRSAMDTKVANEKARRKGLDVAEDQFDSNCITPGTPFMDRLHKHLQYYIHLRKSQSTHWRNVHVILSGHDVPGEGEHKIMSYVRERKREGLVKDRRHCLYGLDADLVMLGLLSHEPHFTLLREEVTFGRKSQVKNADPSFFLLHLSVLREYLEIEFEGLKGNLQFAYDFERILDDFVLLCFFLGNDFLPHLPGLHINEGGLTILFDIYKAIMPLASGYLNEGGYLNMAVLKIFMNQLKGVEEKEFEGLDQPLTTSQVAILAEVEEFLEEERSEYSLRLRWDEMVKSDREYLVGLVKAMKMDLDVEDGFVDISWPESDEQIVRVIKSHAIDSWKEKYYREKLGFEGKKDVVQMVETYVKGLQWVLHYYYHGVQSWSWFYPYYYAPRISDLQLVSTERFDFIKGRPFKAVEQLMAVLPRDSRMHVPECLRGLMEETSVIGDFYPLVFEQDLNGKKVDWEAIVKIPFIDETRLVHAIETIKVFDEKVGYDLDFQRSLEAVVYKAPTAYLSDIDECMCVMTRRLKKDEVIGALVTLNKDARVGALSRPGFPSLNRLPYQASARKVGVNLFRSDSKNDSIVLSLLDRQNNVKLGAVVFVGYPHLKEGKVVGFQSTTTQSVRAEHLKRGIDIGPVKVLASVELEGSKALVNVPLQLLVTGDFGAEKVTLEGISNGDVVFFTSPKLYGQKGKVVALSGAECSVSVSVRSDESTYGLDLAREEARLQYYSSYQVANTLNITTRLLSKVASSVLVPVQGKKEELGLCLKFEGKALKVQGYSRKGAKGWEYSQKALDLLLLYQLTFPDVFTAVQKESYDGLSIGPVKAWLNTHSSMAKIPLLATCLSTHSVDLLRKVDVVMTLAEEVVVTQVPLTSLLNPSDIAHYKKRKVELGQRVVYVEELKGKVGLYGVVVAVGADVEVLLDGGVIVKGSAFLPLKGGLEKVLNKKSVWSNNSSNTSISANMKVPKVLKMQERSESLTKNGLKLRKVVSSSSSSNTSETIQVKKKLIVVKKNAPLNSNQVKLEEINVKVKDREIKVEKVKGKGNWTPPDVALPVCDITDRFPYLKLA